MASIGPQANPTSFYILYFHTLFCLGDSNNQRSRDYGQAIVEVIEWDQTVLICWAFMFLFSFLWLKDYHQTEEEVNIAGKANNLIRLNFWAIRQAL